MIRWFYFSRDFIRIGCGQRRIVFSKVDRALFSVRSKAYRVGNWYIGILI